MKVIKRDGTHEEVEFDKITRRIKLLCTGEDKDGVRYGPSLELDPIKISMKVIEHIKDGITTRELDEFAAENAAALGTDHPEYGILAGRIMMSNHHKNTIESFSETVKRLYQYHDVRGEPSPLISKDLYKLVEHHGKRIDAELDYLRDYQFDYFGIRTLERAYMIKYQTGIHRFQERPQHMYMRVALGIWGDADDFKRAFETYHLMSSGHYTHATPTLFNAGTLLPQLSSCFLMPIPDNLTAIYKSLADAAEISKRAGGIGFHLSSVRPKGSYIRGTNGHSNGIMPMLKVYNDTARYVDQGGGKRMGSFAMYLEPWHPEIMEFLEAKLPTGHEANRAKDLFYALWIPDLFMKKVNEAYAEEKQAKSQGRAEKPVYWSTFCPDECPGLSDAWGTDFDELYAKYEREGRTRKRFNVKKIWTTILNSQRECGVPFLCYKDAANRKSNQQNLGTIRSSNLCTEIMEYSDPGEYATCNLASIALPKHLRQNPDTGEYEIDHEELLKTVDMVTRNLNQVIDVNSYPVPETKTSNDRHRPIGIGVQGLADLLHLMKVPWEINEKVPVKDPKTGEVKKDPETGKPVLKETKTRIANPVALKINSDLFETIYYGAVRASLELAKLHGPYETFKGSPASKGKLQFDLWDYVPESGLYDWAALKEEIKEHGLRNSLLLAPMPTASTAQILGNNETIEPYNHNLYVRRVLAGEFTIVNKHLQRDLIELGLWNADFKKRLIRSRGSVQDRQLFPEIPEDVRNQYMTAYELKQRTIIDMAVARGRFVCQSQSLNLFVTDPNDNKLTNMHLYAWSQGLKTGMYYLRRDTVSKAQQFTVAPRNFSANRGARYHNKSPSSPSSETKADPKTEEEKSVPLCRIDNPDCEACGS